MNLHGPFLSIRFTIINRKCLSQILIIAKALKFHNFNHLSNLRSIRILLILCLSWIYKTVFCLSIVFVMIINIYSHPSVCLTMRDKINSDDHEKTLLHYADVMSFRSQIKLRTDNVIVSLIAWSIWMLYYRYWQGYGYPTASPSSQISKSTIIPRLINWLNLSISPLRMRIPWLFHNLKEDLMKLQSQSRVSSLMLSFNWQILFRSVLYVSWLHTLHWAIDNV